MSLCSQNYIRVRGVVMLAVGVLVAMMSIIGCMGTNRQIQRDREYFPVATVYLLDINMNAKTALKICTSEVERVNFSRLS